MTPPTSSRLIDPQLAAAGGVLRDTVGAIHNLQHLLGSAKVGPRALARIIPDLRAACGPGISAAHELVAASAGGRMPPEAISDLERLLAVRLGDLALALDLAKRLRASERLALEQSVGQIVRDLDGALELVDLLVEASATSGVSLDVTDVIRESAARGDTGSGRGRRVGVVFEAPQEPILINVNPRFAMRLFALAVAIAARKESTALVRVTADASTCRLAIAAARAEQAALTIAVPPVIELSDRFAVDAARTARGDLELQPAARSAVLVLPRARAD